MSSNGDRSEQIITLFAEMMRQERSERETFIRERCAGDEELHRELSEMREWEERMGGFLCDPLVQYIDFEAADKPFHPDELIAGERFKIIRFIEAGGMGVVYEAIDTRVNNKRIAIKCPKTEFGRLLTPELEAALKVRHPNICLVNDTHSAPTESGERIDFLTMEFIDGKTLSAHLREHGRLGTTEALEIARQLCDGVAAAHGSNVLHKDLKSANVMLTSNRNGSLRVVIMDFGLATEAHLQDQLQGGTPTYMAPELLSGKPATKESDIYALGVILYELITGTTPFESITDGSSRSFSRLRTSKLNPNTRKGRVIPPQQRVPKLPKRWSQTILRCLEDDPRERFSDAQSVFAALEGEPLPLVYHVKGAARAVRRSRELQAALASVIFALVVAGSYWIYRYYIKTPEIPAGTKVLVMDVTTSEPELSGITVALKSQLQQSARFDVESDEKVSQVLKQMKKTGNTVQDHRTAREIALRCGAVLVIFSVLTKTPQDYALTVRVERPKSSPWLPAASWSRTYPASDQKALLGQVHNAALWVRRVAGESDAEIAQQDRPVEDTTTSSWQALQLYQQANQKHADGDDNAALLLLDEAIQADPEFAMAHMRKADILISQNRLSEGYGEWEQAIKITDKTELTSRENLRIKAQYYEDVRDFRLAEKSFHEYVVHYPNDFLAWFYWGSSLAHLDRKEEALEALKKAEAIQPDSPSVKFHLALAYLALGERKKAKAVSQELSQSSPELAAWLSGYLALDDGNTSAAMDRAAQLKSSSSPEWQSRGYLLQINVLSESGRRRDAIALLEESIERDRQHGRTSEQAQKLVLLAYLLSKTGLTARAGEAAWQAMGLNEAANLVAQAGTVLAQIGETARAEQILARFRAKPERPYQQLATNLVAGATEQAQGHDAEALKHFLAASAYVDARENKDWLVRALKENHRSDARLVLGRWLSQSMPLTYLYPGWPGIWADSFAEFAKDMPGFHESFCLYAPRYLALRANADPEVRNSEVFEIQNDFEQSCPPR